MNELEREHWVDNDEGLYRWWKQTRMTKRAFVRKYRPQIDLVINKIVSNEKPQHFLAYEICSDPVIAKALNESLNGD
jgi:hypothetical protein